MDKAKLVDKMLGHSHALVIGSRTAQWMGSLHKLAMNVSDP